VRDKLVSIGKDKSGKITICFPYNKDLINKVKSLSNARWNPGTKQWSVDFTECIIEEISAAFRDEKLDFSKEIIADYITRVLKKVEEQISLANYSDKTKKSYLNHIKHYLAYANNIIDTEEEYAREYLLYLIDEKQVSRAYVDQAISALKYLYEDVLNKHYLIDNITRPKKELKLPTVLSCEEVVKVLNCVNNK
jgi:hypothetical protein